MDVIEGSGLRPCKELFAKYGTMLNHNDRINLMTHCKHPIFNLGCMDGKGKCPDYELMKRIPRIIRKVGEQIARRKE